MMTNRRRRRFNRFRPSNALDDYREDPGDDERGAQLMGMQTNNKHCRYVSFPRKKGQLESQPMMTQKLAPADYRQAKEEPWEQKWQPVAARRIKVAWRSRVTGAHPVETSGLSLEILLQAFK